LKAVAKRTECLFCNSFFIFTYFIRGYHLTNYKLIEGVLNDLKNKPPRVITRRDFTLAPGQKLKFLGGKIFSLEFKLYNYRVVIDCNSEQEHLYSGYLAKN
ncbi:hypothetical protein, partial [Desulfotomaculum defluvii]